MTIEECVMDDEKIDLDVILSTPESGELDDGYYDVLMGAIIKHFVKYKLSNDEISKQVLRQLLIGSLRLMDLPDTLERDVERNLCKRKFSDMQLLQVMVLLLRKYDVVPSRRLIYLSVLLSTMVGYRDLASPLNAHRLAIKASVARMQHTSNDKNIPKMTCHEKVEYQASLNRQHLDDLLPYVDKTQDIRLFDTMCLVVVLSTFNQRSDKLYNMLVHQLLAA